MNIRRVAPLLFVALCLGLSALVLRGQIAAHPRPRPVAAPDPSAAEAAEQAGKLDPGPPPGPTGWRVATGAARREVLKTITGQLAAIRAGDADRAWFYQSRGLHRNFNSARAFESEIVVGYPEFGHARSARFGPVGMDPTGRYAAVGVTVQGENGHQARANYRLVREDGGYKVAGVEGGRAVN